MTIGTEELGYIGNIWVRQNHLEKIGDQVGGHIHYFDHVTLLAKGSISVQIDENEPKTFTAPTFVVIKKEHRHKITALVDDTYYYCVFAVRDIDGDPTDIYDAANAPWFAMAAPHDHYSRFDALDKTTKFIFDEAHETWTTNQ